MASRWTHVAFIESDSEPGRKWEVKRHISTGRLGCECPKYRFMRGEKSCHHLDAVRASDLPAKAVRDTVRAERVRVKVANETYTVTRRGISFDGVPSFM